ncbi:MAG: hypothetical protein ACI4S3_04460 [Candidatus Gastranaerophilaceae bacterium]
MGGISDTTAFGLRMNAALTNPTYWGNLDLAWENVDLSSSLAAGWTRVPYDGVPVINPPLIEFGRDSGAYEFGSMLGSTMFTPGMYTDSIHWNFDIGLDNPFSGPNNQKYIVAMLNNVKWDFTIPTWSLGGLSGLTLGNIDLGGTNPSQGIAADDASKIDNSDKAKFNRKARLLEKISEDNKEKVSKIRTEIGSDYKKGIEKLDALLKATDKNKVKTAVIDLYKEDRKSKLDEARKISNKWINNTINADTSSLTTDNVLDVLGTFITNDNYTGKDGFKTLIEKNTKIVDVLLEKAKSMQDSVSSATWTNEIEPKIKAVEQNKTQFNKVFELFAKLRENQAKLNDANVAERYGATSGVTVSTDIAYKNYQNEVNKYNSMNNVA